MGFCSFHRLLDFVRFTTYGNFVPLKVSNELEKCDILDNEIFTMFIDNGNENPHIYYSSINTQERKEKLIPTIVNHYIHDSNIQFVDEDDFFDDNFNEEKKEKEKKKDNKNMSIFKKDINDVDFEDDYCQDNYDDVKKSIRSECCICLDNLPEYAGSCGHKCMCRGCAEEQLKLKTCPICRQTITNIIRIYDV